MSCCETEPAINIKQGLTPPSWWAEAKGVKAPGAEEVRKRLAHLRTYPWSSYRAFAGYEEPPEWLATAEVWRRSRGRKGYRESVEALVRQGHDESWLNQFRNHFAIGSQKFREELKKRIGKPGREETGKAVVRKRATFEEIVRAVEASREEKWSDLKQRHGDRSRAMVIRLARRLSGMTLREIGEKLGGTDYAAVSAMDRRFDVRISNSRELQREEVELYRLLNVET